MGKTERSEVSLHEVLVWRAFVQAGESWKTSRDVAAGLAGKVTYRTVRAHASKLAGAGLLDQAELFPARHYRASAMARERNAAYLQRLEAAIGILLGTEGDNASIR